MRAYVLGGGGHRGASEVGMLRALLERDITPDVILGTSVGAFNGAAIAASPTVDQVNRLADVWKRLSRRDVFGGSLFSTAARALRRRTHIYSDEPFRRLLASIVAPTRFEDLAVPFQCVAACIEDSSEQWFSEGNLHDAVLASSAVPGLLAPVEIAGRHYVDGGVVNSIPVSRALELGATEVYVLHVGHIDDPLSVPSRPWDVAMVAFEISRRHRFMRDAASVPKGVDLHVLPTGRQPGAYSDLSKLRHSDLSAVRERIDAAHDATAAYLDGVGH